MALKPYYDERRKIQVRTHTIDESYLSYENGRFYIRKRTQTTDDSQYNTDRILKLECPTQIVRGNKTSPNAHWFRKTTQKHLTGAYTQSSTSGNPDGIYLNQRHSYSGPEQAGVGFRLSPPQGEAYDKAVSRLNEKLRGSLDVSVDLGEANQVRKMFNISHQIEDFARSLPRSRGRAISQLVANQFLAYKYGWRPLAQTLYGVFEQAYSRSSAVRLRATATVTDGRLTFERDELWQRWHNERAIARCLIQMDYTPANPTIDMISRYTSMNPASIAWELTPWSFVVDWVFDIGGYLRDLESYMLASTGTIANAFTTITSLQRADEVWTGRGFRPSMGISHTGQLSGYTEVKTFNRQLLPFYPFPRFPSFKADLGASRLLSAAALLAQRLGLPKRASTETSIRSASSFLPQSSLQRYTSNRVASYDHGFRKR